MDARQDADNLAWDQSDERWEKALKHVRASATCRKIEGFASRTFGKPATLVTPLIIGGFNIVYHFKVEGLSSQVLVRLPCADQAMFPEEKTMAEVATAACIKQHTQVFISKIFHHGIDEEIGLYMIIKDLGTRRGMSHALEAPRGDPNDAPILNPKMSETHLKDLYSKMAECFLQLAQLKFPCIGSLAESSPGTCEVLGRPISLNMNNMFQLSNVPSSVFPAEVTAYSTGDEWYTVLAERKVSTLVFQHNDMISSEDDCRTKYIARKLFHRLARQNGLTKFGFSDDDWPASSEQSNATLSSPDNSGSFRLWSDDFRPVNVLINDDSDVVGAIDWEFAHVGPSQYTLDPSWWLLLEVPEMWDDGIENWASTYEQRLETWLSAMEEVEKENSSDLPLSAWSFDAIYWKYLDERFFRKREQDTPVEELWKARVEQLTEAEREAMEVLVKTKVEELKERVLVDWDAALNIDETRAPETLFLDISVQRVLARTGLDPVEPWATSYVNAVRDGRLGDAIWARYHIFGNVVNGKLEDGSTVLHSLEEEAVRYKKLASKEWADAVQYYKRTSSADTHPEVIEVILQVDKKDRLKIEILDISIMEISRLILGIVVLAWRTPALSTANINETRPFEQLLLDISIGTVLDLNNSLQLVEPWASEYVSSIREARFGDALWARYHMFGTIVDGLVEGSNQTVMEALEESAMEYKATVPDDYRHALSVYANTSNNDKHRDVLDLLSAVHLRDVSHLKERATFGIKCDIGHNEAYRYNCLRLIELMSTSRAYIGAHDRTIFRYGNCHLRVGTLTHAPDVTYWTAHSVAELIEGHCTRECCNHQLKTSGYSPANRSHRKVCLSSKVWGCS
ncbi:hypothetical protein CEK27_006694 [Fusarium fujikuroi]|nr:hypothetical protein CEK27_006694 [Fusarium fujikuroi]